MLVLYASAIGIGNPLNQFLPVQFGQVRDPPARVRARINAGLCMDQCRLAWRKAAAILRNRLQQRMNTNAFKEWLRTEYVQRDKNLLAQGTQVSGIANCSVVEQVEGDLDAHFARDGMNDLPNRLSYSAEDAKAGWSVLHRIPTDGDIVNRSITYRAAVNLSCHSVTMNGRRSFVVKMRLKCRLRCVGGMRKDEG